MSPQACAFVVGMVLRELHGGEQGRVPATALGCAPPTLHATGLDSKCCAARARGGERAVAGEAVAEAAAATDEAMAAAAATAAAAPPGSTLA